MDVCIFCKIVKGEIPSKIAFEDKDVLAFYEINPVAPMRIVIVRRQHSPNTAALDKSHQSLAGQLLLTAVQVARDLNVEGDGYRIVTNTGKDGGQTVGHLHFHLLGGRHMTWPPG